MESPEAVAAKRRVLVEALTTCLERSRVGQAIEGQALRSVLESAGGELWREGELRLEYVWKILCQQPGLSAKEVAPPLLALKSFEEDLGVPVRLPQALSALPRSEHQRLREELRLDKEDFAHAISELKRLAAPAPAPSRPEPAPVRKEAAPARREPASFEKPRQKKTPSSARKGIATALAAVALLAAVGAAWLSFRDDSHALDTSDVDSLVKLASARRQGRTLTARLADAKWDGLSKDDRVRLIQQVFDIERAKGIHVLDLSDGTRMRAIASDLTGRQVISVW